MGINVASNFTVNAALPLDDRMQVADNTARDAIDSGRRYEGLIVYSIGAGTNYQLVGGILNANWTELAGGGGGGTTVIVQRFSGDASTLIFTLSNDPITEENTQVYINGVYQQKDTYSVSGTTLTFTGAPPIGTSNIEVTYFTAFSVASIPAGGVGTPQLADNSVTTPKIADLNVTSAKLADGAVTNTKKGAPNFVESLNINVSVTGTSYADFTNNSLSFTTTGRLLEFGFKQGTSHGSPCRADLTATASVDTLFADFQVSETTGSTIMGTYRIGMRSMTAGTNHIFYGCASQIKGYFTLAAGTYTIKCQAKVSTSNNLALTDCRFYVREL